MIMKLKRKLLLLTMILTCLCFLATGCNQEEKDAAAPTETKVEEPINEDTADADITKEEAQAFFEEITDSVYYHLLEIPVDDLQTGIQPYYWIWIAAPEQEAVLDDFTEPYITQEEINTYRSDGGQLSYAAYSKSDVQEGLDHIWGTETVTWEEAVGQQEPPMIIETDKYLLVAQGFGGPYDMQFYQIKDVTCDGTAAVVHVYALEWDVDNTVVDLSDRAVSRTTEESGARMTYYDYGILGTLAYQEGATVESLLNNLGVSLDSLGTVDFHLEKDENGDVYLTEIQCSH